MMRLTSQGVNDARTFATPSAAGCAVRDGRATNGWAFWAIETPTGKVTLATLRTRHSPTTNA